MSLPVSPLSGVDHASLHATTQAWLDSLTTRLGDAVCADLNEQIARSPRSFQIDEDVQLSELAPDDAQKLVFGRTFDVTDAWHQSSCENLSNPDNEVVRLALTEQILGSFNEEIEQFAEATGQDLDDLADALHSADELQAGELGINLHSMNFRYKGLLAASAVFTDFNLDPAAGDALFFALRALRIPLESYLGAAKEALDHASQSDQDLPESSLRTWGMNNFQTEQGVAWSSLYRAHVLAVHEDFLERTGLSAKPHDGGPVIAVRDLVAMALDQWGQAELHLHVTVGGSTVQDFGLRASRHDLAQEPDFMIEVHSGCISTDSIPTRGLPWSSLLLRSVAIAGSDFVVLKDRPESRCEDDLRFTVADDVRVRLYEAGVIQRRPRSSGQALDPDLPEDARVIESCLEIIAAAPYWAGALAAAVVPDLNCEPIQMALARKKLEFLNPLDPEAPGQRPSEVLPANSAALESSVRALRMNALDARNGNERFGALASTRDLVHGLLDSGHGPSPTASPLPGHRALFENALLSRDAGVLDRLLHLAHDRFGADAHRNLCSRLMQKCVDQVVTPALSVLIDHGTCPSGWETLLEGKRRHWVLDPAKSTHRLEDIVDFQTALRSHQARQAALASLQGLDFGPAP